MKIHVRVEKISATPISISLEKPANGGMFIVDKRCTVFTQVHTDDGLVGEVHNGDDCINGRLIAHIIENESLPLILGEDFFASERIRQKFFQQTISQRDHAT